MILATGAGAVWAGAPHATQTADQALNRVPRTWHVVVGFSQMLPQGNGSTEAVNQFYPRTLTIDPGDKVTFTDNAANEPHTITFGPDRSTWTRSTASPISSGRERTLWDAFSRGAGAPPRRGSRLWPRRR
jgi:plastocyanin